MPAALDPKEKEEIVDRLFTVFRDHGYDGASIADLSQATGLGKSSLYHHFPRGKEQMVEAVLERARDIVQTAIADVATSPGSPRSRIRKIVATLEAIYVGGRAPCVLGKLATSGVGGDSRRALREIFELWIGAVTALARESGLSPARARHFGEDWVARLQGALVLQAANGDAAPFERAMAALTELGREKRGDDKK